MMAGEREMVPNILGRVRDAENSQEELPRFEVIALKNERKIVQTTEVMILDHILNFMACV